MIEVKSLDFLNNLIIKMGYSKRGFARECGISESTLIQVSNGRQSPRPDTAKKICNVLELEFEDIFVIKNLSKKE